MSDQTPVTPPAVPAAVAPITGPWANDITAAFVDPTTAAQVSEFLRGKVQPYVTGLETKTKEWEVAGQLLEDLRTDPAATYLAITEELFGDEGAKTVKASFKDVYGDPEPQAATPTEPAPRDPEVQKWIDLNQKAEDTRVYNETLDARIAGDNDLSEDHRTLIHPFVVSADGDWDKAIVGFKEFANNAGLIKAPEVAVPAVTTPPAALGTDAAAVTTPPVVQKFTTIDDALDSYFDDMRAATPPPVGSV